MPCRSFSWRWHLAFTRDGLIAATTLGDVDVRLTALDHERCALLSDVAAATGLTTACE